MSQGQHNKPPIRPVAPSPRGLPLKSIRSSSDVGPRVAAPGMKLRRAAAIARIHTNRSATLALVDLDRCDFEILYDRPKDGFAYLRSGTAHIMLEQIGVCRNWDPGALESPLGHGINFQITVSAIAPIVERLASAGWPLFMAPEERWYQTGETEAGVSQFLVQNPDGCLVRFSSPLTAPLH
jgi:hypothetical protein